MTNLEGGEEEGDRPLGPVVDQLGMRCTVAADDLIAGGVVVLKVIGPDGTVRLGTYWSDGSSWIERVGMLRVAERMELPPAGGWRVHGDDD